MSYDQWDVEAWPDTPTDVPARPVLDTFQEVAEGRRTRQDATQAGATLYNPLIGRQQKLRPDEASRRARIEHVFTFLLPMHVDLLLMRHVEGMTLEAMAGEMHCSHVNVIKRMRVAEQDFRKYYGLHYEDPLDA